MLHGATLSTLTIDGEIKVGDRVRDCEGKLATVVLVEGEQLVLEYDSLTKGLDTQLANVVVKADISR